MGPLKVSDTRCTLLLAAEPYGGFQGEKKGEGVALRRGLRWHHEHEAIRPQTAGIGIAWSKSRGRCCKSAHVRDCACSRLVDVHLAKESAHLPFKSVGLRTTVLSTHPLPSYLHPTIYHQHLNNPATVNMFHTGSAPAFLSCGKAQTAARSEVTSADYAAAVPLDWNESGPVTVSTDILWDMRGYSRFVVTK